jgi:hypothetical protein
MAGETKKRPSGTSAAIIAIAAMTLGGVLGANAEDSVSGPIVVAAAPKSKHHHKVTTTETTTTTSGAPTIQLYEDPATGQLFTRPGAGRRALAVPASVLGAAAASTAEIDTQITQKAQAAAQAEVAKYAEQQGVTNAAISTQIQEMQPAWREFGDRWFKKIRIGTLLFADYSLYTHTSWGPQLLENINPPGPGNNMYNAFDITRAYLNFFFSPTEDITARLTPEIYRALDANSNFAFNTKANGSAVGSNLQGQLAMRLKYAFVDWNTPFKMLGVQPMKEDKITFGQQENPFIPWEEALYGFRYVNLVPWNFNGFSSTQAGLAMKGPIKFHESQYLDYDFGVYNNQSWTGYERPNTKQAMGRLSVYPFGAKARFDGLGITGFYDYGYTNATPDNTTGTGRSVSLYRLATLLHYTKETWGLAGEFDLGRNSFTASNLFSGTGPTDFFLPPTTLSTQTATAAAATVLQNNVHTNQRGFDFFGHYQFPKNLAGFDLSPFTAFGMFQAFQPNTNIGVNPFDFERVIAGLEYKYNKYLRISLDSQNLLYYHSSSSTFVSPADVFNMGTAAYQAAFPKGIGGPGVPGKSLANPVVPRDLHAIFLNLEFAY